MKRIARWIAMVLLLTLSTSCATLLHPERKGNNRGPLDTVPLVCDILLFIPGIIPGVVALVVDFGTGAIYLNKGGASQPLLAGDPAATRSDGSIPLTLRLVDSDQRVVRRERVLLHRPSAGIGAPIRIELPEAYGERPIASTWQLEVVSGQRRAVLPAAKP